MDKYEIYNYRAFQYGSSDKNIDEFLGNLVKGGEESLILDGTWSTKLTTFDNNMTQWQVRDLKKLDWVHHIPLPICNFIF